MSTEEKHNADTHEPTDIHKKTTEIRPLALENLPSVVTPKQQIRQMSEINQLSYSELEAAKIIYPGMADVATLNTFRELRTKLMQKTDKNNFILMVSSLALNGGGSYISRNLAAAISLDFEKTALLVDCNLNSPSCDKLLSTPVDFGLTDYLEEPSLSVSDIIYATGIPRLRITPVGNQRASGSEFFTSDRMEEYIEEVKTRYTLIAMGGIENARILLLSDNKQAGGIGNQSDYVGRCFMEHLNVNFGTFVANPDFWQNTSSMQYYTTQEFINENNIGSANITLNIVKDIEAYGRTRKIKEFLQELTCRLGFEDSIQHWVRFNCPGEGAIGTLLEQQANPNSRVYLSDNLDSLGLRKLTVDWQLSEAIILSF